MFERLARGIRHSFTVLAALPSAPRRSLLGQMIGLSRRLPRQFDRPLPVMLACLTPGESANEGVSPLSSRLPADAPLTTDQIRHLADAVAAWHVTSPLGICLRRSLLRYHFLRQAGLPVQIVFGARLKSHQEGGGIGGHAWLTLNGAPYHEQPQDYAGFAPMFVYPTEDNTSGAAPETGNPPQGRQSQIANRKL